MAHYVPFEKGVEVMGEAVLSIINALRTGQEERREILERHGIVDLKEGEWYSQDAYLKGYEEIGKLKGSATMFMIGSAIPSNAVFPEDIDTLEKALNSIDLAYHMNHRGGDIGYYKVVSFDEEKRKAIMECKNPYHSIFDKGLITAMVVKFLPMDSKNFEVILDTEKESRMDGADSCTYNITW